MIATKLTLSYCSCRLLEIALFHIAREFMAAVHRLPGIESFPPLPPIIC
jgi:hypothetical protein